MTESTGQARGRSIGRRRGGDRETPPPSPPHRDASDSVPFGMRIAAAWSWRLLLVGGVLAVVVFLIIQLRLIVIPHARRGAPRCAARAVLAVPAAPPLAEVARRDRRAALSAGRRRRPAHARDHVHRARLRRPGGPVARGMGRVPCLAARGSDAHHRGAAERLRRAGRRLGPAGQRHPAERRAVGRLVARALPRRHAARPVRDPVHPHRRPGHLAVDRRRLPAPGPCRRRRSRHGGLGDARRTS